MGTEQATADFASTFMSTPVQLARVRSEFTDWMESRSIPEEARGDLSIAFSELGSNAVAAVESPNHELHAAAWCMGETVVFEVTNPVVGRPGTASRWDLDDPLRGGGRGLMIVRALTDAVEVRNADGTLTVRCRSQVLPD